MLSIIEHNRSLDPLPDHGRGPEPLQGRSRRSSRGTPCVGGSRWRPGGRSGCQAARSHPVQSAPRMCTARCRGRWMELVPAGPADRGVWGVSRGNTGDHHRYELVLPDGRILYTRVSFAVNDRDTYGPQMWSHIRRDQLDVTHEEFWACVNEGEKPSRGVVEVEPREAIPAGVGATLLGFGVPEHDIHVLKDQVRADPCPSASPRRRCWQMPSRRPRRGRAVQ